MNKVTSKDVAKAAGVSRTTVSLVLNGVTNARIPNETRTKIFKIAKELNYLPNQLAQGLKTNRSKTIAFVLPSISNPFYPYVVQGIEEVAMEHGYTVYICNTYRDPKKEKKCLEYLSQRQVDGLILSVSFKSNELIQEFIERGVAITTFNRTLELPQADQVLVDNIHGGFLATKYLLDLGHQRIAYLAGPMIYQSRIDRVTGYKKAHLEYGLKVDDSLIICSDTEQEFHDQTYDLHNGYNLGRQLLKQRMDATAVVVINDMTAIGAIKALREGGVRVPEDISLVSYDNIPIADAVEPGLTTIDQPKFERGKAAAELLIKRLEEPESQERRSVTFRPSLIIRESCRPRG